MFYHKKRIPCVYHHRSREFVIKTGIIGKRNITASFSEANPMEINVYVYQYTSCVFAAYTYSYAKCNIIVDLREMDALTREETLSKVKKFL